MADPSEIAVNSGLLEALTTLASHAAAAILAVSSDSLAPREKSDRSPVTAADEAAQSVILEGLKELLPGLPVVSEETAEHGSSPLAGAFALVDPLDGTRELLAGRDEYTVNIALVSVGLPVLGVVAAPAHGRFWRGIVGLGAECLDLVPGKAVTAARNRRPIHSRPRPSAGLVAVASRSHLDAATAAYLARLMPAQQIECGSALKFCRLADGAADIYPRLSPTSEWDVAAGHAVLSAAGGTVTRPDGSPLRYGQADFRIPAFIAVGDRTAELPG